MKSVPLSQYKLLFSQKKALKKAFTRINKQIAKSRKNDEKVLSYFVERLSIAEEITEFWGDVPVRIEKSKRCYGTEVTITSLKEGPQEDKVVEIYPNAHTSQNGKAKGWHMRINRYLNSGELFQGGRAYLFNAKSIKELMPIAHNYIEHNILPKD